MDSWDLLEPVDISSKLTIDFESNKWQERKEAMDELLQLLIQNPRLADSPKYREVIERLTKAMANDSNINVVTSAAKCMAGFAKGLRGKFSPHVPLVLPVIFVKFKEKKQMLRDALIECIDAAFACTTLDHLSNAILEALSSKQNPNQKCQLDLFLYRVFRSLSAKDVPKGFLKDLVAALSKHGSDADPEVRDSSFAALGAIMKCIGEKSLSVFLTPELVKDANKMSKIVEYREKAQSEAAALLTLTITANVHSDCGRTSTSSVKENASIIQNNDEMDPWDLLEPVDISSKLTIDFESNKWQERKEAMDELLQLLIQNPRLADSPKYREVIERLTKAMANDSNINVVTSAAKCMAGFAKGLRGKFSPHVPLVLPVIFVKFKEKKQMLRDALIECIDAAFACTTLDHLSNAILEALSSKQNPNQKCQLDLFLYRVFRSLSAKDVPKGFLKDLVAALSKHGSDADPEVRDSSFAALGAIMKCIGEKSLSVFLTPELVKDANKMSKIVEYREKAQSEAPPPKDSHQVAANSTAPNLSSHIMHSKDNEPTSEEKNPNSKSTELVKQNVELEVATSSVNDDEDKNDTSNKTMPDKQKQQQKKKRESSVVAKKTEAKDEPTEALMPELIALKSDRAGRIKDEKSLRSLKWNFDTPQTEHVEQLNASLATVTKPPLTTQLLSKDFKQHIKAIEYLSEVHAVHPECIISNVDLLLKWASLRFFDTNPSVLIKLLEFLAALFNQMDAMGEMLNDIEVQSFLPYLLLKSGDTKDIIRNNVRRIVRQMNSIAVPAKIFPMVLDGLKTKNSRQKSECIAIADALIEVMGINITNTPQVTMGALGACIADRDSAVRNAALNAIVTVYRKMGDRIFPLIGQLGQKERAMLEERIKRSGQGNPSSRADATKRDTSTSRLNQTMNSTIADDVNSSKRARSASGHRRSMAVIPNNSVLDDTDDGNVRPGRRSHAGLSSAVSYASNLNTTLTIQPQNGAGKYQLDPKFFQNEFDDNTLVVGNDRERGGANVSQTLMDKTFRMDIPKSADPYNEKLTEPTSIDLQPIKPVVRPTSTFSRRSESVSSISSLESAEHIDRTVHNISCLQLNIADEAMAQLLHLMNDPTTRQYVCDRTELVLKTMVTQIFHIRSQHLEQLEAVREGEPKEAELSEFMRSICNFLISLTNEMLIMQRISTDTLRSFIDSLLSLVSDQRLKTLNKQIFRSLNIVVIRLCEYTNPNVCFVALIKLIMKYQSSDPGSQMSSLIHKCLTKYTDTIVDPVKIEKVDLLTVLSPIHEYYSRFYVIDEQTKQIPETVKDTTKLLCIYLQRLVVKRRYAMLNYLYPFPENSQLVSYVRRCIRTVGRRAMEDISKQAEGGGTALAMTDELTSIFNRISEDPFNGAIEDLYNFMDIHADQSGNFEQLMSRCEYASIVRRAFSEIRQTRLNREPLKSGVCVRRVLPDETRQFLDQQNALSSRLDDVIRLFSSAASSTANTPSSASAVVGTFKPSPTRN